MGTGTKAIATLAVVAAALAVTTAAFAAPPQKLTLGDQSRWPLDFRVRLEQSSSHNVEIHARGELRSTIVGIRRGEYDVQLQIADLQFTGDPVKNVPSAAIAELRSRLSRPFWITYRTDGGMTGTHFFRNVEPADANLLQMVATELQLVRPADARSTWTAQERDAAGEYLALYVIPQPSRILKRKLKYVQTDGVSGAAVDTVPVAIDQSDIAYSLTPEGKVESVNALSRMHMELSGNKDGRLTIVSEIHLGGLHSARAPDLAGSLDRARARVTDSSIRTFSVNQPEARAQADARLLEGHTTQSILEAAFAADSNDSALPSRLAALFRRRPTAAAVAVRMLVKNSAQDSKESEKSRQSITNALGAAGSSSAIAALETLAKNAALPEQLRVDAIIAFVQTRDPDLQAMRVPKSLINDPNPAIRSTARMMSAALARSGREAHATEASSIDATLISLYRKTQDEAEAVDLLAALGNSVGPAVVPVIEEALRDARAPIRAAAVRALRLAPGDEIDRLIASVIASDKDTTVRADAVFAARFRRPLPSPLTAALLSSAIHDSADNVRSDAIAVLRQNPSASPDIPGTLEQIAENDKSPGIRRQATEALASIAGKTMSRP